MLSHKTLLLNLAKHVYIGDYFSDIELYIRTKIK